MRIDTSTPFGARAAARLAAETIAWLTTAGKDGTPHPKPVWFLYHDDGDVLIYSRPNTAKLRHIARTPRVALNLDSDGRGGDIVILTGAARIDDSAPASNEIPAYQE